MNVIVLGAGITGITSAYILASRGHKVTVIDEENAAAQQCSFSNGCQLSYSHAEPPASIDSLKKAVKWIFKSDAPLIFRPRPSLHFLNWMWHFLSNCPELQTKKNSETMLRLGMYSKDKTEQIIADTNIDFNYLTNGILRIFNNQKDYDENAKKVEYLASLGCEKQLLSKEEVFKKEPALNSIKSSIVGGVFSPMDSSGDVHAFTCELAKICEEQLGVTFHYKTKLAWIEQDGSNITSIETSRGKMKADSYVCCLGSYSSHYLRKINIRAPIYPMKGYSITVPAWKNAPEISIGDEKSKVVYGRIGDKVRASGTAEFSGVDYSIPEHRIAPLIASMNDLFPDADMSQIEKWSCLRPQTPDAPPIIGKTKYSNLYLNTGHGMLGWTHGCGTAYLLADIMEGHEPEIDMTGLTADRF